MREIVQRLEAVTTRLEQLAEHVERIEVVARVCYLEGRRAAEEIGRAATVLRLIKRDE